MAFLDESCGLESGLLTCNTVATVSRDSLCVHSHNTDSAGTGHARLPFYGFDGTSRDMSCIARNDEPKVGILRQDLNLYFIHNQPKMFSSQTSSTTKGRPTAKCDHIVIPDLGLFKRSLRFEASLTNSILSP